MADGHVKARDFREFRYDTIVWGDNEQNEAAAASMKLKKCQTFDVPAATENLGAEYARYIGCLQRPQMQDNHKSERYY